MRIRTQKKRTYMVREITVFASMVVLANNTWGTDEDFKQYRLLEQRKLAVEKELKETQGVLKQQLEEKETIKEKLKETAKEKENLREQHTQVRDLLKEIKATTGGSGSNTPLPIRFRKETEKVRSLEQQHQQLEEKLQTVQKGAEKALLLEQQCHQMEQQLQAIQRELVDTNAQNDDLSHQYTENASQLRNIKAEIGEGETPPAQRVRKLSDSLKKDAKSLTEATKALDRELQEIPEGEDYVSKVTALIYDLKRTKEAVGRIDEKLFDIPGDGLLEKVNYLLLQNQALKSTQEDVRNQEMIAQTLHTDLTNATNRINYLEQIVSEQGEQYAKTQANTGSMFNHLVDYLVNLGDEEK